MIDQSTFSKRLTVRNKELMGFYLSSLLAFLPFFFFYFRITAFGTVPMDDYENFILKWDGKAPNFQFYSPQGYRWLFFGIGFFFYKTMPFIDLTNMDTSQAARMQAFQALAFTSYLFTHLFFFINYRLVREMGKTIGFSIAVSSIIFLFCLQSNIYTIDAISLAWASLVLFYIKNFRLFSALLITSVFVNEKIPLLFFTYFSLLILFDRQQKGLLKYFIVATIAVSLYFLERSLFPLSGYEYQTQPQLFFERIGMSLPFLLSFKGFYMNILPLLILTIIIVLCLKFGLFKTGFYTSKIIILLPIFFFLLGMFACSNYGIGRIALHTLPFFTVPVALLMELLERKSIGDISSH